MMTQTMCDNVFKDITEEEREKIFCCFGSKNQSYTKGETIAEIGEFYKKIGILTSGRAHISCVDFDGNSTIIEQMECGGVFGAMFSLPMEEFAFFVVADSPCEVCYIDYDAIVHPCQNACEHHSRLINNLFHIAAYKARGLSLHINVLSRRTIRQKLMTYFETLRLLNNARHFKIPFSYTALAEYICVDRSAMMRELKKMREEKILSVKGKEITLAVK